MLSRGSVAENQIRKGTVIMTHQELDQIRNWKPKGKSTRGKPAANAIQPETRIDIMTIKADWRTMMQQRSAELEPKLSNYFAQHPGAFALFLLLKTTQEYHSTRHGNLQTSMNAAGEAELRAKVGLITTQWWGSVLKMERTAKRRYGLFDHAVDGPSGFADLVAEVLGIDTQRPMSLEEFTRAELARIRLSPGEDDL
jgi:hypothetical protein